MSKILSVILLISLVLTLSACGTAAADNSRALSAADPVDQSETPNNIEISDLFDLDDLDSSEDESGVTYIEIEDDSFNITGSGARADGSVLTINTAGTYSLSGSLTDGQIRVNAGGTEKVKLILNGVSLNCSYSSAIYVINSAKTVITLAEGTQNSVSDGAVYSFSDDSDEPDAAIFSKSDLTLNGEGALTVTANYSHGIVSKDDLKITGGDITVESVDDGLRGRDSIVVKAGVLNITAGSDGLQSNNDEDPEKGYIDIEGGTLNITAVNDGLQAETALRIAAGEITVITGGGAASAASSASRQPANGGMTGGFNNQSASTAADTPSTKALKAGVSIVIEGGNLDLDSADDALNSNDNITINGGTLLIASGDDGMHADSAITINGGDITIEKSYEGIESQVVTLNAGTIHLVSSDDGINVTGGSGSQEMMGGRPGQALTAAADNSTGTNQLYIYGGYLYVNAGGDGIDVNGSIEMSGGTVIVNGPTNNGNGPLDYYNSFTLTGGFLLAVGSSGMAQSVSNTSSQYTVMLNLTEAQAAGTLLHLENAEGVDLLTFLPAKAYQSILFSCADLENGQTVLFYTGGSAEGEVTDGLYNGGEYTPGTQAGSLTLTSVVTGSAKTGGMSGTTQTGSGMLPGGTQRTRPGARTTVTPQAQ